MRHVHPSDYTIRRWAARRARQPRGALTVRDAAALASRRPLRYGPVGSPLGGRIAMHLQHPDDRERVRLLALGDAFAGDRFLREVRSAAASTEQTGRGQE
jgi:hypothetical protein